jgi:hypothetical protein
MPEKPSDFYRSMKQVQIFDNEIEIPEQQLETIASAAHDIWAHWMKYFIPKMEAGEFTEEDFEKWKRQMETPYYDLSEEEKNSDRDVAKLYLKNIID